MWLLFLLKYIAFPAALIWQGLQDFQVILSHKEHFFFADEALSKSCDSLF